MNEAVIVATARSPIGRAYKGAFNDLHGAQLAAHAISHAVERARLAHDEADDVILGCAYPEAAQGMALSGVSGSVASPFDALTPREMEVALLLNQGMRQEAIAKRLNLSAKTVNTHKSRLFEKLAIRDSIALARLVSQYGLGDPAHAVH